MRARAQEGFKSDSFSAGTQGSVQKACSKILRQNRHQHDFTIGAHQPEMIWRSFHFWPHRMTKRTRPLGQKFVRLLVKLNQHWSHDLAPPQTSCRYSLRRQHIQTSTSTCISLSLFLLLIIHQHCPILPQQRLQCGHALSASPQNLRKFKPRDLPHAVRSPKSQCPKWTTCVRLFLYNTSVTAYTEMFLKFTAPQAFFETTAMASSAEEKAESLK